MLNTKANPSAGHVITPEMMTAPLYPSYVRACEEAGRLAAIIAEATEAYHYNLSAASGIYHEALVCLRRPATLGDRTSC